MRVASNKLKDTAAFFHEELKSIYSVNEIEAMLDLAVEHYLGFSKTERLIKAEENLNQSDLLKLYDCAKALKTTMPLQYILGECWFYGLKFYVNPHVLIPRPETEELAELILKENKNAVSILDLCTGSGCLAITLKNKLPEATVFAVDVSKSALKIAEKNSEKNNSPVTFFEDDVLNFVVLQTKMTEQVEVIMSNPPYINASEKEQMNRNVIDHEPHLALFVEGGDAIVFYKKIIDLCKTTLRSKGKLYFELNPLTANSVKEYALRTGLFNSIELIRDMSGNTRFLKAVKF